MEASTVYTARIATFRREAAALTARKRQFAFGRLASFLSAPLLFFLVLNQSVGLATGLALMALAVFVAVTTRDLENSRRLQYTETLIRVNEEELEALAYHFSAFGDGAGYLPQEHPYAADLDIVGTHSVYRMLNRTSSAPGADLLAAWLLEPAAREAILRRQEAVQELQPEVDWRQQLRAKGRHSPLSAEACARIRDWVAADNPPHDRTLSWLSMALPCISAVLIALCATAMLPWKILWLALAAHLLLARQLDKLVSPAYRRLGRAHKSLAALQDSLAWILQKPWRAARLLALQMVCGRGGMPADMLLTQLSKILDRLDLRLNPLVHFPLNIAVFWDWHQYTRLERWRQQHHRALLEWIDVYAETEVLSSFATIAFDFPDWSFPRIADRHFTLSASALGHPMLAAPVRNDIVLEGQGKIMLITGSNMAGKSTFLRTVGVNIVLAMAGAPVRAGAMSVSVSPVRSSMRIADNLEENISTFYAELKKLKLILESVRRREPVFLLLDEILRGTNSQDRHTGARALIRQLLEAGAMGMLATHDLALTDMENSYPGAILNRHFDVQVQGEELSFDYLLKPGVCQSMNASLLMRKIGIDIQ